jgi:hypothetical protein
MLRRVKRYDLYHFNFGGVVCLMRTRDVFLHEYSMFVIREVTQAPSES